MKFNAKYKNFLSLFLAVLILVSSVTAFAGGGKFKDVPKNSWAFKHIERTVDLGYLNGRGGGVFDPKANITFIETLAAFSRFTNPTDLERQLSKIKYEEMVKGTGLKQDWKIEALEMALYKGIVKPTEIKQIKNVRAYDQNIVKSLASVFLARAMDLEEEANELKIISLGYSDELKINEEHRKFIKVLLDKGILNKDGDGDNKFNPNEPYRREIIAKMLSEAEEYRRKNPSINKPEEKPLPPVPEESRVIEEITGQVDRITREIGKDVLVIVDDRGKETGYIVEDYTEIKSGGRPAKLSDIRKGQEIDLRIEGKTRRLLSIDFEVREDEIAGVIDSINLSKNEIIVKTVENGKTSNRKLVLDRDSKIERDTKRIDRANLRVSDYVEIKTNGNFVSDLKAKSSEIKLEGEIISIDKNTDEKTRISLITKDKEEFDFLIDPKTKIFKDRKKVKERDLRLTDNVYIIARYSLDDDAYLAYDIDAKKVTKKIFGYVVEISNRINRNTAVRIKNSASGEEETYELSQDAIIKVDGKTSKSLPLNPGYQIEMYVEGGVEIIEVYVDTSSMEISHVGKIINIGPRDEYIEIELQNIHNAKDQDLLRVYLDSKTKITDRNFKSLESINLRHGDFVNIVGIYRGADLYADTIQIR